MDQPARYSVQKRIKIVEAFRDELVSEGHSRRKLFNQGHNKAPPGQIQGVGKCTGYNVKGRSGRLRSVRTENHIIWSSLRGNPQDVCPSRQIFQRDQLGVYCTKIFTCFRVRHRFYNFRPMQIMLSDVRSFLSKPFFAEKFRMFLKISTFS